VSGPHFFGLRYGKLPQREVARRDRIAERHGAYCWVQVFRDGRWMGWFEAPNNGEPHDRRVADAVMRDVERSGGNFSDS
jgi:hypothetical protein